MYLMQEINTRYYNHSRGTVNHHILRITLSSLPITAIVSSPYKKAKEILRSAKATLALLNNNNGCDFMCKMLIKLGKEVA